MMTELIDDEKTETTSKIKVNIPRTQADLMKLSERVSETWSTNSWLTLRYTTQVKFDDQAKEYAKVVEVKNKEMGTRAPLASNLGELNAEINASIAYIKDYVREKFGRKVGPSYYKQFGIEKSGSNYRLPFDGDKRGDALATLLVGLADHDFNDKTYGLSYWSVVKGRYDLWSKQALASDRNKSKQVSESKPLKQELIKTLKSIVGVIKANYPDTFRQELRVWGFMKERH